MGNVSFTIEEENLICIYHKHDRRRTIAAISDALPDMDGDMRPLAEQTIHKLHNMTDAAFEEAQFTMTLSKLAADELRAAQHIRPLIVAAELHIAAVVLEQMIEVVGLHNHIVEL